MTKKLILGLVLLLIAISVFSVVSYSYYYTSTDENAKYDNIAVNSEPAMVGEIGTKVVQQPGCYEEVIQVKNNGECLGVPQEKKLCYKHILTCSGQKTETIDCYPEIEQVKGDGECFNLPQEKKVCYKQVESCSGMKTISIDCYPEIVQESGYGDCLDMPQENGQCYRIKELKGCN